MRHVQPRLKQKPRRRRYHLVDDDASAFDYELPDWLVGAN